MSTTMEEQELGSSESRRAARRASSKEAELLTLVAGVEALGRAVEWEDPVDPDDPLYCPLTAPLYVETDAGGLEDARDMVPGHALYVAHIATVKACVKAGWLSIVGDRTLHFPATEWYRHESQAHLRQLALTYTGALALAEQQGELAEGDVRTLSWPT
jgi:hypothetical protein